MGLCDVRHKNEPPLPENHFNRGCHDYKYDKDQHRHTLVTNTPYHHDTQEIFNLVFDSFCRL